MSETTSFKWSSAFGKMTWWWYLCYVVILVFIANSVRIIFLLKMFYISHSVKSYFQQKKIFSPLQERGREGPAEHFPLQGGSHQHKWAHLPGIGMVMMIMTMVVMVVIVMMMSDGDHPGLPAKYRLDLQSFAVFILILVPLIKWQENHNLSANMMFAIWVLHSFGFPLCLLMWFFNWTFCLHV